MRLLCTEQKHLMGFLVIPLLSDPILSWEATQAHLPELHHPKESKFHV